MILAVTSAIGIMSYAGVVGSLIIIEVVPFLVLAVGVDNLFIIVHAYEVCVCVVCVMCVCVLSRSHMTSYKSPPPPPPALQKGQSSHASQQVHQ